MQTDTEHVLHNLYVLSQVTQNDKLLTNQDLFTIHPPTSLRGAWRYWNGEDRASNMSRIRACVRQGTAFASHSLTEANDLWESDASDIMRLRVRTSVQHHFRMLEGLLRSTHGLENMLTTYRDDPVLTSQIHLLVSEIKDFVSIIEPHSLSLRSRFDGTVVPTEREHRTLQ